MRSAEQRQKEDHHKRLKSWGETPDTFQMDNLLIVILRKKGIDPQDVINEIGWKRRKLGIYAFTSRKSITPTAIMHHPLETLPADFPPLRISAGRQKNATITVSRLMPTNDTEMNYTANKQNSVYIIRSSDLPLTYKQAIIGSPINQYIEGLEDDRSVLNVRHYKIPKRDGDLYLNVDKGFTSFQFQGSYHKQRIDFTPRRITDSKGSVIARLEDIPSILPDPNGHRIYARPDIRITQVRITTGMKEGEDYLAILPIDNASVPRLKATGVFWDQAFCCYLIPFKTMHIEEISAILSKAKRHHFRLDDMHNNMLKYQATE